MVRPVMYWSFAKRWMTSSMVANMRGNPCGWGLADERTLTHGLGQDNKSAAWRASEGAAVRDRGMPRCARPGLRIVLPVVLLADDVAARLVLLVTDRAPFLPRDLPVGDGFLAVGLHLLLLRLEPGRLLRRELATLDALLDAGVLTLLAPVDAGGGRHGGRENEDGCGGGDRESLHGGSLASPRVTLKRAACIGRVTRSAARRPPKRRRGSGPSRRAVTTRSTSSSPTRPPRSS